MALVGLENAPLRFGALGGDQSSKGSLDTVTFSDFASHRCSIASRSLLGSVLVSFTLTWNRISRFDLIEVQYISDNLFE